MMSEQHGGRVVVITGASAGIGRATAIAFARQGAKLGLIARGQAGLEGAKRDVEAAGGTAVIIRADVADAEAVEAAAERVERELGPIDIWINSALVVVFSPVKEMNAAEFRRVTEVTYLGQVHGTLAALKRMLPRDRGKIIQIGSALAYRGVPLQAAYCGAKHATQGFCDSLQAELQHDGSNVRLTMVQLPAINTPLYRWFKSRLPYKARPVPPAYQPEVAVKAILWAADHDRREINVTEVSAIIVLGDKLLPGFGDWLLARLSYPLQMTAEPEDPHRPHNLWEPLDATEDHGAHGAFDAHSYTFSPQLWLATHRPWALGGVAALAGVTAAIARRK
ncbi:MAG TPA: SDR family oxidoreductase [Thermomicrobiales bacterium]